MKINRGHLTCKELLQQYRDQMASKCHRAIDHVAKYGVLYPIALLSILFFAHNNRQKRSLGCSSFDNIARKP